MGKMVHVALAAMMVSGVALAAATPSEAKSKRGHTSAHHRMHYGQVQPGYGQGYYGQPGYAQGYYGGNPVAAGAGIAGAAVGTGLGIAAGAANTGLGIATGRPYGYYGYGYSPYGYQRW